MSDQTMQDVLGRLDAQEKELARLRAARPRRRTFFSGRKRRGFTLGIVALLVALVPLSILAATPFSDLTGGVHDPDIDTIYNLGIANGFENPNDPSTRLYAPTQNVTREEMASFLTRTASLSRMAYTTRASAAAGATGDDLGANGNATNVREYMTVKLTVPGRAGGAAMLVKVDFTGYAYARSAAAGTATPGCPCLLRGEITVNGETAGGAPAVNNQIVTRTVVGANAPAVVDPGPAERTDFSGSRVFVLAPGEYTFAMTLVRESGTAGNVGFGFGNMQAETVAFAGTGSRVVLP